MEAAAGCNTCASVSPKPRAVCQRLTSSQAWATHHQFFGLLSSSLKPNKTCLGQICFIPCGQVISRNSILNKGQQDLFTHCGPSWSRTEGQSMLWFPKWFAHMTHYFMKHFTVPVLGDLGLKTTCPEWCTLVQSQTRVSEDLSEIRRVGVFWESPVRGTSEVAHWHGDPRFPIPAFLGSQGPLFSKQRKKSSLAKPVQSIRSTVEDAPYKVFLMEVGRVSSL